MPLPTDNPNSADQPIQQIGRYKILEKIGTGGMARVYRALDTSLERYVAVKILYEHLADDETFRARFEREAKFLASFNHPNVISIYDYAARENEGRYLCYMVMTYLPSPTLKDVIDQQNTKGGVLPQAKVLQIIKDIAAALAYAHDLGMIHRDIKPGNILFDERGQAILTDFGIARLAESSRLTQENVAVGTPAYMAPEQAAGTEVDARTDIYSLGVILYELLAGAPPFGSDGSLSVLLKHLNESVPSLGEYDHIENPLLDAVIVKAMAKNPDDRYQSAPEMAADLERALNNLPPSGMITPKSNETLHLENIPTKAPNTPKPSGRKQSPQGILITGLIITMAILGVAFFVNQSPMLAPPIPTLQQPAAPTVKPTLDPDDFRRFGGVDSMVDVDGVSSMTSQVNMPFQSDFSEDDTLLGTYWPLDEGDQDADMDIRRIMGPGETYQFINRIPNWAATTILQDYFYDVDIVITTEQQLESSSPSNAGYGVVFHYVDENNYGVFAIDGAGRYSIWFLENREWRELRNAGQNWSGNRAINPIGQVNELRLEIIGATLTGYVNGEQVTEVTDDFLTSGGVGLYLATPPLDDPTSILDVIRYEVNVINPSEQ